MTVMQRALFCLLVGISMIAWGTASRTGTQDGPYASPVGHWKTIDDISGKPKSILYIYAVNGMLYGRIERIFPKPGYDQNELCTACKGTKHNQRMVGMVIMEGLKKSKDVALQWIGGHILDPENGSTYRCQIQLSDDDQKLTVRGYIGLPLFGRSQTWLREPR
jgi:uncharacterized protein (DUF2147 family)